MDFLVYPITTQELNPYVQGLLTWYFLLTYRLKAWIIAVCHRWLRGLVEDQPLTLKKILWDTLYVDLTTMIYSSIFLPHRNYIVPTALWETYMLTLNFWNNIIIVYSEQVHLCIFLRTLTWYHHLQYIPIGISRAPDKVIWYWRVVLITILLINLFVSVFLCLDKLPNLHQKNWKFLSTFCDVVV